MDIRRPLEAELLGILCEHKEFVKIVSLRPEDFIDPRNAIIFRALSGMKTSVSAYTLAQAIQSLDGEFDLEYLEQIWMQAAEIEPDVEDVCQRVVAIREDKLRMEARHKLAGIVKSLDDPKTMFQSALDQTNSLVMAASQGMLGQSKPTAPEILDRAYAQKTGNRFPSGLVGIDSRLTSEGMRTGNLWILVGAYKSGKSTVSLSVADNLLRQGRSVSYIALEDNDIAFNQILEGVHSGVPIKVVEDYQAGVQEHHTPKHVTALKETEAWLRGDVKERWRVYDASYSVHDWKRLPTLIAADCALYKTDCVIIDYVQGFGEDRELLEQVAQMLIRVAAERDITILALSQMSNDGIRTGTGNYLLGTKSSGAFGAATHCGIQLHYDPESSDFVLTDDLLKEINSSGVQHFVGMNSGPPIRGSNKTSGPAIVTEIGLWLKTVRRGRRGKTFLLMDRLSGKILLQYDQAKALGDW